MKTNLNEIRERFFNGEIDDENIVAGSMNTLMRTNLDAIKELFEVEGLQEDDVLIISDRNVTLMWTDWNAEVKTVTDANTHDTLYVEINGEVRKKDKWCDEYLKGDVMNKDTGEILLVD